MDQEPPPRKRWIDLIEEEDLAFIKRLVLFSGSLQDLATAYDVTCFTVQQRLDRLIAKIKIFDDLERQGDFDRHLRAVYADDKLDSNAYKRHLAALADLEVISGGAYNDRSNGGTNGNGHGDSNGNHGNGSNGGSNGSSFSN